MTLLALALAIAAQALPPLAGATPWELVAGEEAVQVFIDPASLRRDGGRARVRMLATGPSTMADGTRAAVAEVEIDCAGRTATLLRRERYGEDGRLLGAIEIAAAERRAAPVGADGGEAAVFRRVCGPDGPGGAAG